VRTKLFASSLALAVAYGQEAGAAKGLVLDEAAPIANADVQLKRHRSSAVYKQVQTSKDGTFQINDVAAGKYDILVMSAGCISQLTIGIRVRGGELLALGTTTLRNGPATCPPGASYLPKIENGRLDSGGHQVVGSVIEIEFAKPLSERPSLLAGGGQIWRGGKSKPIRTADSNW
jgi:Carboxypeptidase regulatory-like domain